MAGRPDEVPVLLVTVMLMPGAILSSVSSIESVTLLLPAMSLKTPPSSWMTGVSSEARSSASSR